MPLLELNIGGVAKDCEDPSKRSTITGTTLVLSYYVMQAGLTATTDGISIPAPTSLPHNSPVVASTDNYSGQLSRRGRVLSAATMPTCGISAVADDEEP